MKRPDRFSRYLKSLKSQLIETGHAQPHIMLVTCFDLRYPGLIHEHMEKAAGGYFHKRYDHVSLAGGGLSAVVDFPPHPKRYWQKTFVEQVALSKKMHDIIAVLVLEHRTCGAYKEFGLLNDQSSPAEELAAHQSQVWRVRELLHGHFPRLMVDFFLLDKEPEQDRSIYFTHLGR